MSNREETKLLCFKNEVLEVTKNYLGEVTGKKPKNIFSTHNLDNSERRGIDHLKQKDKVEDNGD